MHTSTLRGVFPEPKPVCRRNFIKENVKSIKHMQGMLQEAAPRKKSTTIDKKRPMKISVEDSNNRLTHRAMQTEREEDLSRLYDTGVIKYPSPGIGKRNQKSPQTGQGDHVDELQEPLQNITINDNKDFVKENKCLKNRIQNPKSPVKIGAQVPHNYQRGVVPKYLRERKEDLVPPQTDFECPPGHVLLPEDERKETLRVLRQSYADRIQELNMMPVRNDTLKMKKRKMEIEEELKRIDGGIKVFQRPKVYVKINA